MKDRTFDVAVIGAGLGGLSCASFLAKQGLKVGVFEQHYLPGGYCHSFSRGGYHFDAAIEYIGCCGQGQDVWNVLRLLGAERLVEFDEMDQDGFDRLYFPKHHVAVCKGFRAYVERLAALFPRERDGLQLYAKILEGIWREIHVWGVGLFLWKFRRFPTACPTLQQSTGKTLADLFEATIRSRQLRGILAAQSGNYALAPSRVDLVVHAITVMHFHEGAYYPRGGVQSLADALVRTLRGHGGQLFLRKGVRQIRLASNRVTGIECEDGEFVRAKIVVSNADPQRTLLHMVSWNGLASRVARQTRRIEYSLASFQVYLGVTRDLGKLGLGAANHWLCPSYDFEGIYRAISRGQTFRKNYMLVTAMSLKDRSGKLAPTGHHVMKLLTPVAYRRFAEWSQTSLGRRGKPYKDLKERLADSLIMQAERLVPGLQSSISCKVIGSPLTNVDYTRAPEGAMYGLARTPSQSGPAGFTPIGPVPGLYFTGTGVYYPGVLGALGSGIMSGTLILRESQMSRRHSNFFLKRQSLTGIR